MRKRLAYAILSTLLETKAQNNMTTKTFKVTTGWQNPFGFWGSIKTRTIHATSEDAAKEMAVKQANSEPAAHRGFISVMKVVCQPAASRQQFKVVANKIMDDGVTPYGWCVKQLMPRRLGGERAYWVDCGQWSNLSAAEQQKSNLEKEHGEFVSF